MSKGALHLVNFAILILLSVLCGLIVLENSGWIRIVWMLLNWVCNFTAVYCFLPLWMGYKDYRKVIKDHEEEIEWDSKKRYWSVINTLGTPPTE